ncbi:hypothetical protein PSN45_004113 [Yamadazyma tenuis]|uniref:LamB/YcsF n=1 Tax=Candida tenuis (strain ATCC 10573 / BCRC 21748 / CBS 615 / JCM 9827 / NBRC 10315 / NRRL Y-1498 / VKM Y-70) TaxID=590646 RepID=G3B4G0_CANTC|nr:LamB/YcsF [Yamadazyma tenuis ATCC 10573]EGV63818.1 LamB/YcsF [Yamadazyma tenuis ATCC 10573]WEJ96574.1 hypothetical protein PSN45_004113 [Yamadazyma tenuis]
MTDTYTKAPNALTPINLSGPAPSNKKLLPKYEINCDMGEGFGPWKMGPDEDIMPLIDRANIACGGHASDPSIMLKTIKLAKKYGVAVGAHPGLPDKQGFGRRSWAIAPDDVYTMVLYQVGALKAMCDSEGVELSHIKPHGELYFYTERDAGVKAAVIRAAKVFGVPLVAGKSADYQEVAAKAGQQLIHEVYPDLHISPEGYLVKIQAGPKSLRTPERIYECVKKAGMVDQITNVDGEEMNLGFGGAPISFCLHSDMPTALENVIKTREAVDEINQLYGLK